MSGSPHLVSRTPRTASESSARLTDNATFGSPDSGRAYLPAAYENVDLHVGDSSATNERTDVGNARNASKSVLAIAT